MIYNIKSSAIWGKLIISNLNLLTIFAAFFLSNANAVTLTVNPTVESPPGPCPPSCYVLSYEIPSASDLLDVNVPQFDPSLGTLQSVEIVANFAASVGWGWSAASREFVMAQFDAIFNLLRPDMSIILSGIDSVVRSASGTFAFTTGMSVTGQSVVLTTASDLALFTGTSALTLSDRADAALTFLQGTATPQGNGATASAYTRLYQVTYTFDDSVTSSPTQLPAPPSAVLFGTGLLAIAAVGRRRRLMG